MADDLYSQLSQLGGSIPGWGALMAIGGVMFRLGSHLGAYRRAQDAQTETNARLAAALDAQAAALNLARERTDARFEQHAAQLSATRERLASLPDREEMRAMLAEVRADINHRRPA